MTNFNFLLTKKVRMLRQLIETSQHIVFLGGAGVSTESGIPDFRSKDGLYNQKDGFFDKYDPEYLVSTYCLYENPELFYEFLRQKMDTRGFQPNMTHIKLAELEKQKDLWIVTQNIDGLHQKAGSQNVLEIHGNTRHPYCRRCGKEYSEDDLFNCEEKVPLCTACLNEENPYCPPEQAYIRPRMTLYGEFLQPSFKLAIKKIQDADLMIVGGTSLTVAPASGLVVERNKKKCKFVIINRGKTPFDSEANLVIHDSIGKVFSQL